MTHKIRNRIAALAGVAGIAFGGVAAVGISSGSASAATSTHHSQKTTHHTKKKGISASGPVNVNDGLGGGLQIFKVTGQGFTCHVADNSNWQEGPGISCLRTSATPLKDARVNTGENGDVTVVVSAKTGCFVAENNNWSDDSVAISCPVPATPTATAATTTPATPATPTMG